MRKKLLITLSIILAVALLAGGWFKLRLNRMYDKFNSEQITDMDLSILEDGTYLGEAGDFVVGVKLSVTVVNQEITDIEIQEQRGGKGYEAHDILPRMIEQQSPDVDVVSGATGSSRCIMIAVKNALTPQ